MRGGAQSAPPPIFICENNRKGNKTKFSGKKLHGKIYPKLGIYRWV